MSTLHVKYRNESRDFDLNEILPPSRLAALGISSEEADLAQLSDTQLKSAVADQLDVNSDEFSSYTIERHDNGNATLRPQATFG